MGADFVRRMEDVLDLYAKPCDPRRPVVGFDGQPRRLIAEARVPLPAAPGRPERVDDAYRRRGTVNPVPRFEPLAGRRHVAVTARRTGQDLARRMKAPVDVHHPEAAVVAVVLDSPSTHSPAALRQTFPPAGARRLLERLEFHDPPEHGSRLTMAELESSAPGRRCLDRRIPDQEIPRQEIAAREAERNATRATVQWRFTVIDARTKLHRLYPA